MNTKAFLAILFTCVSCISLLAQTSFSDNENGNYEDMLTPQYYNTAIGSDFRLEINKFIHLARLVPFQHPFQSSNGEIQAHTIRRSFGDGIGPGGSGSHHPAIDYYPKNTDSVYLYAACNGYIKIDRTVSRYRHFISITNVVKDSSNQAIGKMVVIYAHIDLDLDALDNIDLDGKYVEKGQLISKNLYSGTIGGPHLHFEIRYYRANDTGDEDFYGGQFGNKTAPSAGSWTYGFWNPDVGYGFAHPYNHINQSLTSTTINFQKNSLKAFPNPTIRFLTIQSNQPFNNQLLTISDIQGFQIYKTAFKNTNIIHLDLKDYKKGIYILNARNKHKNTTIKIVKE